jgi:hypothetical protein
LTTEPRRSWRIFFGQLGRRGRAGAADYFYQIVIVIIGVYLGITLERRAADRDQTRKAEASLTQLVSDLRRDEADMLRVQREQERQTRDYHEIAQWLATPATQPAAHIDSLLRKVTNNPTVYPRRGIYASMVSAGQLALLPETVRGDVVNLYENIYTRLAANGEQYDYSVERDFFPAYTEAWDPTRQRLITTDAGDRIRFRNVVLLMAAWSEYYASLLADSQKEVVKVMNLIRR